VAYLLDVNALVALHDSSHQFNARVYNWFSSERDEPWTTCPITENGFVRILSQPSYKGSVSPGLAADLLRSTIGETDHERWPDDVSIIDSSVIRYQHILGHRQITDTYLLALVVNRSGRLVTLDAAMPIDAVVGATKAHVVMLG
jgi:uncharacterized protein